MTDTNLIAFKGCLTLDKAIWDNIWGMYVSFDLEQRPHEKLQANPFKKFTKMRKGKVGTRFDAIIIDVDGDTIYEDELMLKGWNDGTTGWKVTFWLAGDITHPFIVHEKGSQFELAAVELDDDNTAVDQVKRERVETAVKHRKQGLSNFAALLCRTPEFYKWLHEAHKVEFEDITQMDITAKTWMYRKLNIRSRAELDTNNAIAGQFHRDIRRPYAEWMESR